MLVNTPPPRRGTRHRIARHRPSSTPPASAGTVAEDYDTAVRDIVFPVVGKVSLHRHLRRLPQRLHPGPRGHRHHGAQAGRGRRRPRRHGRLAQGHGHSGRLAGQLPHAARRRGLGVLVHPHQQRLPRHRRRRQSARVDLRSRHRAGRQGRGRPARCLRGRLGQRRELGLASALRDPQARRHRHQPVQVAAGRAPDGADATASVERLAQTTTATSPRRLSADFLDRPATDAEHRIGHRPTGRRRGPRRRSSASTPAPTSGSPCW